MVAGDYRVEEDLLGKKEVPASAYYGVQTVRACENFNITGYKLHSELIVSLALVKKASALANMEIGSLEHTIGNAIVKATEEIASGELHDQLQVRSEERRVGKECGYVSGAWVYR